jgi:hypothetical protein
MSELIKQNNKDNNLLFQKIKDEIINQLNHCDHNGHIDDIGNLVGIAVGKHIGNKNIWAFEKSDFILGFNHGYSLEDGTHG